MIPDEMALSSYGLIPVNLYTCTHFPFTLKWGLIHFWKTESSWLNRRHSLYEKLAIPQSMFWYLHADQLFFINLFSAKSVFFIIITFYHTIDIAFFFLVVGSLSTYWKELKNKECKTLKLYALFFPWSEWKEPVSKVRLNASRKAIFHVHNAFIHTRKWGKKPKQ